MPKLVREPDVPDLMTTVPEFATLPPLLQPELTVIVLPLATLTVPRAILIVFCVTLLLKLTVPVLVVAALLIVIVPLGVDLSVIVPPKVIDLPEAALRFKVASL